MSGDTVISLQVHCKEIKQARVNLTGKENVFQKEWPQKPAQVR